MHVSEVDSLFKSNNLFKTNSYSLFSSTGQFGGGKNVFTVGQSELVNEVYERKLEDSKLEISFE
jgi:hypothetical protein